MPTRIPLRVKLIALFVLIGLVPLLTVTAITITQLENTQRQNALEHANQIAKTAREEINTFIVSQFSILESIQTVYPVLSVRQREDFIEQTLFLSNTFTDLSILDGAGNEVVRKNRIEVVKPDDLRIQSSMSKFIAARDLGAYIGPLYLASGKPFFTLSIGLASAGGEFLGVASAEVDARILQDVVKKASAAEESGHVYIVNQQGTVIAHPDISLVLAGADLSSIPSVRATLSGTIIDSLESYQNDAKEEVIGTAIPIELSVGTLGNRNIAISPSWYIITEQRATIALRIVREMFYFELVLLAFAALAAATAAVFVAGNIVQPISLILSGLQQFGQNNLGYRVQVQSNDETRDLADGFNRMAENLGKSVAELKEEREAIAVERNKLALVLSGISDAVIAIDQSGKIITWNSAAEKLIDVPASYAINLPVDDIIVIKKDGKKLSYRDYAPASEKSPPYLNDAAMILLKNGRIATASLLVSTLAASPGVNIGWILTLHDRTKSRWLKASSANLSPSPPTSSARP